MFLLNVGYRWHLASSLGNVNGVVILPAGNSRSRLDRTGPQRFRRVLLDPQLYEAAEVFFG